MQSIDLVRESKVERTSRVQQLEAMFDVPANEASRFELHGEFPYDEEKWSVGLIVGPSGCGKSTILREVFGDARKLSWKSRSVIDDFSKDATVEMISSVCQSVGFNTIPNWMRPFSVLSNGEQFRVTMARLLLEASQSKPIVIDEFTSVVDRQVAQIASHAVQKFVRKNNRQLVVASCHYDIIDWLQPDWILQPATMHFARRSLQPRPKIEIRIERVPYDAWRLFAPYHYLTADLHVAAQCFVLFANDRPASFGGVLHRPHADAANIKGLSRLVTIPDWQGLGLAMVLCDTLAAAYKSVGMRFRTYPAHPSLIRSFAHSASWSLRKKPGTYSPPPGKTSGIKAAKGNFGGRPCAVYEYEGQPMKRTTATKLLARNT